MTFGRQTRKKVKSDPNGGVQLLTKRSKKLSQGTEMGFICHPTKKECRNLFTGRQPNSCLFKVSQFRLFFIKLI